MSNRYNPSQASVVDQDARNMATLRNGVAALSTEINAIWAAIDTGTIGITAAGQDVDSLALGGGACSIDWGTSPGTTLNFSVFGGRLLKGQTVITVAPATVSLAASATNYIEVDSTGTVFRTTSGFTVGRCQLYIVVTGASTFTAASVTNAKVLLDVSANAATTGVMLSTAAATKEIPSQLGGIAATTSFFVSAPAYAAVLAAAVFVNGTTIATDAANIWSFAIKNRGAAGAGTTDMLDTSATNSTNSTGGSALTAKSGRPLALNGTPANLITAANDTLEIIVTKAAAATAITAASLRLDFAFAG
jgi:hypothetical protein